MKKTFKPALFVLLMCGVFGVDEVKSVSVMEGDSVTLNPDRTQIQGFNEIEWRFKDSDQPIAYSDGKKPTYPVDERFRDRLKLDHQTGSLTITNMKTKHSGLYKLQIELNSGSLPVNFDVTVYESPSVIDAVKGEMNFESVKKGDRVTLQTDVTLSGDELIVWRCGEEGKLIAKADIEAKSSPFYDTDEGFRGRLELENKTGSLIITNTSTTDSGFYTVKISSKEQTVYKRFTVTVTVTVTVRDPGLSPGAVAGIVIVVLLCVAAAAAAGVIYHRRKISELRKQTLTVREGEDVILKPNKEIKKDDYILWMFGDEELLTGIAELKTKPRDIFINDYDYVADGIFRDRLELDKTTGSLTIRNSRTTHSGLYKLHITSSRGASEQTFVLTVKAETETLAVKSVEEGDSVTLYPDPLNPDTEIQGDDQMLWMFGDQEDLIAQIRGGTVEICADAADGIFRGKLKLNKTGSLTITDISSEHTGLYKLKNITSRRILYKKFRVFMPVRRVYVTAGESVHLSTDLTTIQRDDVMEWRSGEENSLIAEIKGGTGKTYDGPDERFRDRLVLNNQTGDLTIKNSSTEHAGRYKLKICSRRGNTNRTYIVTITYFLGKRGNESASVEMQPLVNK